MPHAPTFVIFSHWACYFLVYSGEGDQYHGSMDDSPWSLSVSLHCCILTHPFWHMPVTSETRPKRVSLAAVVTWLSLPVHSYCGQNGCRRCRRNSCRRYLTARRCGWDYVWVFRVISCEYFCQQLAPGVCGREIFCCGDFLFGVILFT